MDYVKAYFEEVGFISNNICLDEINKLAQLLHSIKEKLGRVFFLGSGGGASNASHATCDFRKLCQIEAYSPYDNVSELTARTNDDGWRSTLDQWLKVSNLNGNDCVFVFSVGGGDEKKDVSVNIVNALKFAREKGSKIVGVVGEFGGYTAKVADVIIKVPVRDKEMMTPLTESFQSIVWHLLATHPLIKKYKSKWESLL